MTNRLVEVAWRVGLGSWKDMAVRLDGQEIGQLATMQEMALDFSALLLYVVVVITRTCPHCTSARCKRFGSNRSGSARCRCSQCNKTFTLHPNSPAMTHQKEAQIVAALQERISQRGIARTLKVARLTIRNIRKKVPPV